MEMASPASASLALDPLDKDVTDGAGDARNRHLDPVTSAQRTAGDGAEIPAVIGIGPGDGCNREAQRTLRAHRVDRHALQVREQRWPFVPRRISAWRGDVVARRGRQRNGKRGGKIEACRKGNEVVGDGVIPRAVPPHAV